MICQVLCEGDRCPVYSITARKDRWAGIVEKLISDALLASDQMRTFVARVDSLEGVDGSTGVQRIRTTTHGDNGLSAVTDDESPLIPPEERKLIFVFDHSK